MVRAHGRKPEPLSQFLAFPKDSLSDRKSIIFCDNATFSKILWKLITQTRDLGRNRTHFPLLLWETPEIQLNCCLETAQYVEAEL